MDIVVTNKVVGHAIWIVAAITLLGVSVAHFIAHGCFWGRSCGIAVIFKMLMVLSIIFSMMSFVVFVSRLIDGSIEFSWTIYDNSDEWTEEEKKEFMEWKKDRDKTITHDEFWEEINNIK